MKLEDINGVSNDNSVFDRRTFLLARPKRGEKPWICFKASLFCVNLTTCKHMHKFCYLHLFRK